MASFAVTIRDQFGSRPGRSEGGRATRWSPDDFAEGGVQTRADAHAQHAIARQEVVDLVRERERN